jgi:hypothetical protein
MRREERDRSDARVAALSRMAETDFLPEPEPASEAGTVPIDASAGLFADAGGSSPWGTRLAIAGAIAVVLIVVSVAAIVRAPVADANAAHGGAAAPAATAPLELIALSHTQNSGSLTVSGRVQNPDGGRPVSNLTATVFLFGPDGAFLTSGRSSLDVPTLDTGSQTAFAVTIPVIGSVARYRVSFRDSAGHPVSHIDRRNSASMARNE